MSRNLDSIELAEWEFDELVQWATWQVITAITSGQPMNHAMYTVIDVACRWSAARAKRKG